MAHQFIIMGAAFLLAFLKPSESTGSFPTKKVQIHVPHTIQHHHHTHTKYHFITLPLVRAANRTEASTTPRTIILPVMPVLPMNTTMTLPVNPQTAQPNGIQTNNLQPQQPNNFPLNNVQPNSLQPNNIQPQQPNNFPPNNFQQLQPNPQFQLQQQRGQFLNPSAMYMNQDYDYVDANNRRTREKVSRLDPPMPSMKFKTIINVQETKKIPISELFDLSSYLKNEPSRKVKFEALPDKTSHIKQTKKIIADWNAFRQNLMANPYPGLDLDNLEYNFETATFQSKQEPVVEKPEWATLKKLLEKHIHEDFPGLKVEVESKQIKGPLPSKANELQDQELKHVGYIVIANNKQSSFTGGKKENHT